MIRYIASAAILLSSCTYAHATSCTELPWVCERAATEHIQPTAIAHRTFKLPHFARKADHAHKRSPAHLRANRADLIAALADKVDEIRHACNSRLISAHRPGAVVAGSGRPSLHSAYPSRAADMAGNPKCIYAHLQHWRGGYSIDYARVRHVHISWSPPGSGHMAGREWHARFNHYGGGGHRRYARRHMHPVRFGG